MRFVDSPVKMMVLQNEEAMACQVGFQLVSAISPGNDEAGARLETQHATFVAVATCVLTINIRIT
jgi:hypothetical protein